MLRYFCVRFLWTGMLAAVTVLAVAQSEAGQPESVPSGQVITPLAPTGAVYSRLNPGLKDFPSYTVGQAVKTRISADGNTLLVREFSARVRSISLRE